MCSGRFYNIQVTCTKTPTSVDHTNACSTQWSSETRQSLWSITTTHSRIRIIHKKHDFQTIKNYFEPLQSVCSIYIKISVACCDQRILTLTCTFKSSVKNNTPFLTSCSKTRPSTVQFFIYTISKIFCSKIFSPRNSFLLIILSIKRPWCLEETLHMFSQPLSLRLTLLKDLEALCFENKEQ